MEAVDTYRTLARYNTWMNARLYEAAAGLGDEERRRELGAFFGSVHRTLNHLIFCDHSWLLRLAPGLEAALPRDAGGNVVRLTSLDQVLYGDFELLRTRRRELDRVLEDWVAGLTAADLDAEVSYRTSAGVECRHPLWWALTHVFNHQTHHRGQVTTLMFQLGHDPGVTDLIAMMRG